MDTPTREPDATADTPDEAVESLQELGLPLEVARLLTHGLELSAEAAGTGTALTEVTVLGERRYTVALEVRSLGAHYRIWADSIKDDRP